MTPTAHSHQTQILVGLAPSLPHEPYKSAGALAPLGFPRTVSRGERFSLSDIGTRSRSCDRSYVLSPNSKRALGFIQFPRMLAWGPFFSRSVRRANGSPADFTKASEHLKTSSSRNHFRGATVCKSASTQLSLAPTQRSL